MRLVEDDRFDEYKRVAFTVVAEGIHVSTVWLGIDHNFTPYGPPLIFETMVFVELDTPVRIRGREFPFDGTEQHRWATEAEAVAGHERVVADLLGCLPDELPPPA